MNINPETGANTLCREVPFTVILTISDPEQIAPVYNEMRQNVIAAGAQIADIQNAVTITQRV